MVYKKQFNADIVTFIKNQNKAFMILRNVEFYNLE